MPKYVIGLDIGNNNICATMSVESSNNGFEVVDYVCKPSDGISKDTVVDINKLSFAVRECLKELEDITGHNIDSVYLGVNSDKCRIIASKGYTYIESNSVITEKDIEKVYLKARDISVNEDEYIIDSIINSFYTEEYGFTNDPLGVKSNKLELEIDIVVGIKKLVDDLKTVILLAGYEVNGVFSSINSLKNIFLSEKTALNNVAIIDVGSDKTVIGLFKCNKIEGIGYIPLGGRNITKDLSICLSINEDIAESLKKECSSEYLTMSMDEILLNEQTIEGKLISDIISARLTEIINYINRDLVDSGIYDDIDFIVLTGCGLSYFENIEEELRSVLNKKIKNITKNNFYFDNSSIITSIGIVKEVYDRLKLICNESVFLDTNAIVDNKGNEINSKQTKKRGLSRVKAFLYEMF